MNNEEIDKAKSVMFGTLDKMRRRSNGINLFFTILFTFTPIICQCIFLGGNSMQDYTEKYPESHNLVYLVGAILATLFFMGLLIFLPICISGYERNKEIKFSKVKLLRELEKDWRNISYEEFETKVTEEANFIYLTT